MKILIVEDEKLAFERLKLLLENSNFNIGKLDYSSTIDQAISNINKNDYDLAFFDIELSDGLSFDILEQTKISFPIIFTTAYNQYAIQAFKHNSIDYLLKPFGKIELQNALDKYQMHWGQNKREINEKQLVKEFKYLLQNHYKKRFTVKIGEHIRIIEAKDIKLVHSQNKGTYFRTTKDILVDYSLDRAMELLSPTEFFRISRKYIVSLTSIKDIIAYSNSRLKIVLDVNFDDELIVSREKVKAFKIWLES